MDTKGVRAQDMGARHDHIRCKGVKHGQKCWGMKGTRLGCKRAKILVEHERCKTWACFLPVISLIMNRRSALYAARYYLAHSGASIQLQIPAPASGVVQRRTYGIRCTTSHLVKISQPNIITINVLILNIILYDYVLGCFIQDLTGWFCGWCTSGCYKTKMWM